MSVIDDAYVYVVVYHIVDYHVYHFTRMVYLTLYAEFTYHFYIIKYELEWWYCSQAHRIFVEQSAASIGKSWVAIDR